MRLHRLARFVLTLLLATSGGASAQIFRAYLTLDGLDTNPCTLQQPCRLLPAALAAVASGGEIWMLDSANYNTGPVTITKSVSILAVPGVLGSVVALGGNAIEINTAGVNVSLRNLNIAPFSAADANKVGVRMTNGSGLALENVHILDFSNAGRGVWVTTAAQVSVIDSIFRNNSAGTVFSNGAQARVSGSRFEQGVYGIYALTETATSTLVSVTRVVVSKFQFAAAAEVFTNNGASRLYISDSVLENTATNAASAYVGSYTGSAAHLTIARSSVSICGSCLSAAGTGARIYANDNTINNCLNGMIATSAGVIESTGNNMIGNCSTPVTGVSTVGTY